MPHKVVFLGSKPIGYFCLEYLLQQQQQLGISVVAIKTQKRKEFGTEHNLEMLAQQWGVPLLSNLNELPPCDIIYSVQHNEILKQEHISKAGSIAVNLHLAPLPEYRGCNQFSYAILDQAKTFGVTLHQINTKIDNGAILFEKRFAIPSDCWVHELYQITVDTGISLFKDSLPLLIRGDYKLTDQEQLVAERGTSLHFRAEIDELKKIDLAWSKDKIERVVRATYMPGFEPPFTLINDQKVYIKPEA